MKKLKLLLAACTVLSAMTASAQVYIETDLTSQFNSLATSQWNGSSGQVGWAAPQVTTNSGLTVAAWESYCGDWNGGCTNTGTIMSTTVTGLVPGTYKIELYGAAAFTFNRNFGSEAFTGDITVGNGSKSTSDTYTAGQSITENTGVFLYAKTSEGTYNNEIPIWYADNFNGSGLSTAVLNGVVVGENGIIEIGMSKTSKSTNWHVVQLKGVTATVDAEATFATFKAEAEGLYNSPMNATVLSELQTAANVDLSSAGADEYKTAIETLQAKIIAANTSVANYAEAKVILDAANIYDDAGQASYASDETIAAIQTVYSERTLEAVTADQKTAASAALVVACKAQNQPKEGCDMTPWLVNPSFESGFTGWINYSMAAQDNTSFAKDGNTYVEKWQPNGTFAVTQTINVPAGVYNLSAKCLARLVNSAKLYAGTAETAITIEDASNTYSVEFKCADKATIGYEGVGNGAGTSWLCVDNFQLTYVRQLTNEELLDIRTAEYEAAMNAATAFDQETLPTDAKSTFQNVISTNTVTEGTASEYADAATALNDAVATAKPLVTPYAEYLDTKDAVVTMKDADTYIGDEAKSTLEGVINTTASNVEAATDAATITSQTADLMAAANTFVKAVIIKADQCLDLTCLIKNPHFKYGEGGNKVATGWTLAEGGWITEHRLATHNFEAWHAHFDLSQTITDLPKGTYKVTLQGFARHDDANVTNKTKLYCGVKDQEIKNIMAEWSTTSFYSSAQPAMGDNNRDSQSTEGGETVYRPNGMTGAYYWFQQTNSETGQPFYTNEVQTVIPNDGDLTIGFKCDAGQDWVLWDNFHLYYYGSAIAVELDEAAGSSYNEDIEKANVTLKKTIYQGWNTITVPFAAEAADFAGEKLYKFTGDDETELKFTEATSIEPNVPYLLKATTATNGVGEFKFNGVTVKAADELTTTGTNYNFVGTYADLTVADGDYILGDDAFYRSNGGNHVKAYRAYIQKKSGDNNARLTIFIDGKATAIDAIDGETIGNADIYNLAGQKVKSAQKGVYIQNGKKFVVK